VEDVYVVTNNHYRGQAVANAIMLAAMSRGRLQKAPEPVMEAFPEALAGLADADPGPQTRLI